MCHIFNLTDSSTNRMQESLKLFEFVCKSRWFKKVAIIIFLNKTDLLHDKLQRKSSDIKDYYPHFKGNSFSFDEIVSFIWVSFTFFYLIKSWYFIILGTICGYWRWSWHFFPFNMCYGNWQYVSCTQSCFRPNCQIYSSVNWCFLIKTF